MTDITKQSMFNRLLPQLTTRQFEAARKADNLDDSGIIWWKIGEGKTRIAIAWTFLVAENPRPLVICSPNAFRQWKDEIELLGFSKEIRPMFISTGILSRRSTLVVDFDKVNCIIVDELWMFKNPKANRSMMLATMTHRLPSIGLSGSMMTAGNIEDIYGQAKAMGLDKKIAGSLSSFRNQFEIGVTNFAGFLQRYPRKNAVQVIQRRLNDNVDIYFPKDERLIRDIPVSVEPTEEQIATKKQLVNNWMLLHDEDKLEIKSAAVLLIKLLQVSDGFVKLSEGNYLSINSKKIARLKELCTELFDAGERQLLVWTGFRKTAEILSQALPFKSTLLTGDGGFDVYGWQEGKVKITYATVGSGASLNDFSQIAYSIFYSTSFSALQNQQARGRTNRKSSLPKCSYYYQLNVRSFPDSDLYQRIEENKTKEEIVIETCKKVLNEYNTTKD